jgi:hypothetical protein
MVQAPNLGNPLPRPCKPCLDLQMLAEAAASSRTCEAIIKVKVSKLKRG